MKRLVLAGGGHAHLSTLRALARSKPADVEAVLITPSAQQSYSGMLPGWMAGHYTPEDIRLDLRPLLRAAGVRLIEDRVMGMDADRRCVGLSQHSHLDYDVLSLDTGAETNVSWLEVAGARLVPVKPLEEFIATWPRILAEAGQKEGYRLAVVGGGAAGVELALAASYVLHVNRARVDILLVCPEEGLLATHAPAVRRRMMRILEEAEVQMIPYRAVGAEAGLLLSDGSELAADRVIAATGVRPPAWLALSRLALGTDGFVAVDALHRSLSHANVFAAGDICTRPDTIMARAGVHAVHAGPVLTDNLLATLTGGRMRPYQPRRRSLYLLSCGAQHAVGSWGRLGFEGHWVWRWKDQIDRRFIRRFSQPVTEGT